MTSLSSPLDRRAFGRRPTYQHAIAHRPGRTPLRCVVCDISVGGALLDFGEPVALPPRIRVVWEGSSVEAECDVRHVQGIRAGVQFLGTIGAQIYQDILTIKHTPEPTAATADGHVDGRVGDQPVIGTCLVHKPVPG